MISMNTFYLGRQPVLGKRFVMQPECFIIAEGNNRGNNWAIPSMLKVPIIAH